MGRKSKHAGQVSVWAGHVPNLDHLREYTADSYSANGIRRRSRFDKDFRLGSFDHDFQEINQVSGAKKLSTVMAAHSYSASFAEEAIAAASDLGLTNVNATIIRYDLRVPRSPGTGSPMTFVGTWPYSKSAVTYWEAVRTKKKAKKKKAKKKKAKAGK